MIQKTRWKTEKQERQGNLRLKDIGWLQPTGVNKGPLCARFSSSESMRTLCNSSQTLLPSPRELQGPLPHLPAGLPGSSYLKPLCLEPHPTPPTADPLPLHYLSPEHVSPSNVYVHYLPCLLCVSLTKRKPWEGRDNHDFVFLVYYYLVCVCVFF